MAIYRENGTETNSAHSFGGGRIDNAFSEDATLVFSSPQILKVMQYNVGSWYDGKHDIVPSDKDSEYYNLQRGIIQRNNPDIMFMNEYTMNFSKSGRSAFSLLREFFPYIHEQGGDLDTVTSGRCIASKYPITNYTVRPFNDGGYYYDSATITVNGVAINVVITHLHWDDISKRTSEIQTIISLVGGYSKFILSGDFNTLDCYNTLSADYTAVIKPLTDAGFNVANCGDFGFLETYDDAPDGTYVGDLDNIVTSSNIPILGVYVDETKRNDNLTERIDHLPLVATIEL